MTSPRAMEGHRPYAAVIFLDVDGVLNTPLSWGRHGADGIDEDRLARVKQICDVTDAGIVVSSAWRLGRTLQQLRRLFRARGLTPAARIIGMTPDLVTPAGRPPRGIEIAAWLEAHPHVERFVILDDDDDMEHLSGWLIKTNYRDGLLDEHVDRAIAMLSGGSHAGHRAGAHRGGGRGASRSGGAEGGRPGAHRQLRGGDAGRGGVPGGGGD